MYQNTVCKIDTIVKKQHFIFLVCQLCFWRFSDNYSTVDFSFSTKKNQQIIEHHFFQSTGKWKPSGSKKECGERVSLSNIVGGKITKNGDFPYMALLGNTASDGKTLWSCGGSLINKWYVLTAAHCIRSKTGDDNPPK